MKTLTHKLNNSFSNKILNKGYFSSSSNKKIVFSIYMMIKNEFKRKLGRKCKN